MNNYWLPYLILMAHFISGAFWLALIIRRGVQDEVKEQWIKYGVYVLLFNLLWHSLIWFKALFTILGYLLMVMALVEWMKAIKQRKSKILLFLGFLTILLAFWKFIYLDKRTILFTYFIVVLFDGACQISGQLLGKTKLIPTISPKKTVEGLTGGILVTLLTVLLVRKTFAYETGQSLILTLFIAMAAFTGDLLASANKRKSGIRQYSNLLPGHGGILDRFDSFFLAGGITYLIFTLNNMIS